MNDPTPRVYWDVWQAGGGDYRLELYNARGDVIRSKRDIPSYDEARALARQWVEESDNHENEREN